ncbi:MAG: NAD-dependent succinate-semialdehyde dehydrogenase [Phormidesmis sp. FL-bin-119]|nr:NAD-dependent succinate-semialdehyde dehydrogenase [Pedobacter sp.]
MSVTSVNPANGKIIKSYKADTDKTVSRKVDETHKAWLKWRETTFAERSSFLQQLGSELTVRKDGLARLMAIEMGKPLKEGVAEIDKCVSVCEYYAANGKRFLQDKIVDTDAVKSYVSFQPLGVVLAIMPWNFPFWQVFRFLAPSLMAGNCGLLKHASNVSGCAKAIDELVKKAGFPDYVFQNLFIPGSAVHSVIAHPLVKAVTLTGSTEAGIKVAQQCGMLLKKTVLELGGSDPYLILEDADLEHAAQTCANSKLINNGQSCVAAKRFIVVKKIEKEFTTLFREKMMKKKTGDPFESGSDLGPMARADLRDEVHEQVLSNIKAGAKCVLGGTIPKFSGNHAFYEPTILTGVKKGMPAYSDEIFGPVASIISAKDTEDAIRIANDTSFGLGAAVFTRNISIGEEIARTKLQAGCCFVNSLVKSDPKLPFGGIKQSGHGRELSVYGIHEFVNIKTVYIK